MEATALPVERMKRPFSTRARTHPKKRAFFNARAQKTKNNQTPLALTYIVARAQAHRPLCACTPSPRRTYIFPLSTLPRADAPQPSRARTHGARCPRTSLISRTHAVLATAHHPSSSRKLCFTRIQTASRTNAYRLWCTHSAAIVFKVQLGKHGNARARAQGPRRMACKV